MPNNRQEQFVVPVTLRDGSIAEIRPIGPADKGLLVEGLPQMSPKSKFARFGSGIASLSAAELRYLTDVNQVSHVAWGAVIDDEPAGVGRYIVDGAAEAEIAVTVVDEFQRRGLGRTPSMRSRPRREPPESRSSISRSSRGTGACSACCPASQSPTMSMTGC